MMPQNEVVWEHLLRSVTAPKRLYSDVVPDFCPFSLTHCTKRLIHRLTVLLFWEDWSDQEGESPRTRSLDKILLYNYYGVYETRSAQEGLLKIDPELRYHVTEP